MKVGENMTAARSVSECLDLFRGAPREDIFKLIKFTESAPLTVGGWLMGTSKPPSGETMIKVAYFFDLNGWRVQELEESSTEIVTMARYWMSGVITTAELKEAMQYSTVDNQALLSLIYGKRTAIKASMLRLKTLLAEKQSKYEQIHSDLALKFRISFELESRATVSVVSPAQPEQDFTWVVETLAGLLRTALPLAEAIDNDGSAEDFVRLRALTGLEEYVQLSTALNRMTGWRQRS